MKPGVACGQGFQPLSRSNQSKAESNSMRSSGSSKMLLDSSSMSGPDSGLNQFQFASAGSLVVIENPIFTDIAFSKSARSGDEVDIEQLCVANDSQSGFLTVVSASIAALTDT